MEINLKEWQCYARGLGSKTYYHQSFVLHSLLEAAITSPSFSTHGESFGFTSLQSKWKQMFMQPPGLKCNDTISSQKHISTLLVDHCVIHKKLRQELGQSVKNNNEKGRMTFILLGEKREVIWVKRERFPGQDDYPGNSCLESFEKLEYIGAQDASVTGQFKRKAL